MVRKVTGHVLNGQGSILRSDMNLFTLLSVQPAGDPPSLLCKGSCHKKLMHEGDYLYLLIKFKFCTGFPLFPLLNSQPFSAKTDHSILHFDLYSSFEHNTDRQSLNNPVITQFDFLTLLTC